jgi:hypothetical protein
MSSNVKTLIERACALPAQDRIALVEDVLDSLNRADPAIGSTLGAGGERPPSRLPAG